MYIISLFHNSQKSVEQFTRYCVVKAESANRF